VNAICIAIRALTEPGDGVLIQQPVYHPFEICTRHLGRTLLVNELVYSGGKYSINFEDFESKIKQAKLFILCSPHNPVGRVWTQDELTRMGELCLRHGVPVIADEIHQDFVFPGHQHKVFADLDARFADITITCTSPSKTFNLAGLLNANIFIQNETMRRKFNSEYASCGLGQPGVMGLVSCKAAYTGGTAWLEALIEYLAGNMARIQEFLQTNIPAIQLVPPEGTYLAWLDFSALGLSAQELDALVTHKAKLWLNNGPQFGAGGTGFQRMNVACPRSVVDEALKRLQGAFG
jgi:cystathionine beta-lyase